MEPLAVALIVLVILVVVVVPTILVGIGWIFAQMQCGFFYPESNKEYVVLRGKYPVGYIHGDVTRVAVRKTLKKPLGNAWEMKYKYKGVSNFPLWQRFLYKH